MKTLIWKRILVLSMLLLTVCASAFAESIDDVLKDCKLDRSRWKVVEWFKAEKFVRFYDSASVSVTGPGQFDAVIYDYFYDGNCKSDSCKQRGNKHYHMEKWGFNTTNSTGTLRSMTTKDITENVVDSYDYPANMQIASELKRKSIEDKTMQKIKEQVKNDKEYAATPKPNPSTSTQNSTSLPKISGLVPLPMAIGASDGEWTYLGRFMPPGNFSSPLEWQTRMTQYTGSAEADDLYDVYFYHSHYGDGDGQGCPKGNSKNNNYYKCVLKFVPLDRNGRPEKISGGPHGIHLFSMSGATKGVFAASITRIRTFYSITHQQLIDVTNANISDNKRLNGEYYSDAGYGLVQVRHNAPYYKAMQMTNCHYAWQLRHR